MKRLWQRHGTKLLGVVVALLGGIAFLTPAELQVLGLDAHTALRVGVITSGLLVILRGLLSPPAGPPEG